MVARVRAGAKAVGEKARKAIDKVPPPSPNPMTNVILTDLLLRTGGQFLRRTIEHALLQTKYDKHNAKRIVKGRTMKQTLISTAVARLATRSVPGAILVSGGMLAKLLYDRSKGHRAAMEGRKDIAEQAKAGAES